jgi:hypothetical protein
MRGETGLVQSWLLVQIAGVVALFDLVIWWAVRGGEARQYPYCY